MVGGAVVEALRRAGFEKLLTRTHSELDIRDQAAVHEVFDDFRPDVVVFAAARVGGIHANNSRPAEFIHDNLAMATNAVHAAWQSGVRRFLYLGSTCIYPRDAPQPIPEAALLTGPLEITNEAYAIAKIAGLKLCEFYRRQYGVLFHSAMPTNLYGPGDNYHPENSHVLPGLLSRFHEACEDGRDEVVIWGSGRPRREFLHVHDLAGAVVHLLQLEDPPDRVNIGTGRDISIRELADLIAQVVGFQGQIVHDRSRPDGTPVKRTDTSVLTATGWEPQIALRQGLEQVYQSFLQERKSQTLRIR